jgi:hypothetical protein
MKTITLFSGGKIKNSPFCPIVETYIKRIHLYNVCVKEVTEKGWSNMAPAKGDLWVSLCEK